MCRHDSVRKVDKYVYYHCNCTTLAGKKPAKDDNWFFLLDAPVFAYFASTDIKHCKKASLMLNVKARPALAPPADISSPPAPVPPAPAPP